MKVLHAPVNIGNQAGVLSRYERKLGIESDLVINFQNWPNYPADKVLSPLGWKSEREMEDRLLFGLRAPLEYDVFHYYFGRTLLNWGDYNAKNYFPYLDLELAKRLGRPVFFTLQGCDVRIASKSTVRNAFTPCRAGACNNFEACLSRYDGERMDFISEILPKADRFFFLNPELGHDLPGGEFIPYSSVDIDALTPSAPLSGRPPRIVHAPSDGSIKGTAKILEALETLKGEYQFELVLIRNMSHEQAMQAYREADIVIDQILAGWYGGFAVEAMALGKPVLCYLRTEDFKFVPQEMIADNPILNIRPDHLVEDIASVLDRISEWRDWSARSRAFVEKWHNPSTIAAAMIDAYRDPQAPSTLIDHVHRRPSG